MIVLLTHEHDLDGLGAQAIILRYFKIIEKISPNEIDLRYAQYLNFVSRVNAILKSSDLPSKLIISDLGFNEDFNVIFPIFKQVGKEKCKIYWFDHHLVDDSIKKKITNSIFYYENDTNRCAAEVVKDHFLPNDDIAIKIAQLARDSDFKTRKSEFADQLQKIIGYNRGDNKDKNKKQLVKYLSEGDFDNPWFTNQFNEMKNWLETESANAIKNKTKFDVVNVGEVEISFANIGGGKIVDILREDEHDMLAYIGVDGRYNEIIIYSDNFNCRDFALEFNGGGHVMRAGFKYDRIITSNGKINPEFIIDVKKKLKKFTHS